MLVVMANTHRHGPDSESTGDGTCEQGQVTLSDADVSEAIQLFDLAPMQVLSAALPSTPT